MAGNVSPEMTAFSPKLNKKLYLFLQPPIYKAENQITVLRLATNVINMHSKNAVSYGELVENQPILIIHTGKKQFLEMNEEQFNTKCDKILETKFVAHWNKLLWTKIQTFALQLANF